MQKDTDDSKRIDELSVLTNQDMKRIEEKGLLVALWRGPFLLLESRSVILFLLKRLAFRPWTSTQNMGSILSLRAQDMRATPLFTI